LQLIKKSVQASDPEATLILYGSYARGDFHSESDIDLLVLIDKDKITWEDRKRIGYPLYDIELDSGIMISTLVYSRRTWNRPDLITPFYENVNREGVVL
jgi:predicted nucleotidyltransferase